jgi:hypothetical protein
MGVNVAGGARRTGAPVDMGAGWGEIQEGRYTISFSPVFMRL